MKGIVFDIQKFSLHDGPGIRTTIFLKGCNMRCRWCHNPESLSQRIELGYDAKKCVSCGRCVDICPTGAHKVTDGTHSFDRDVCKACGTCANVCIPSALRLFGKLMSVDEVVADALKDRKYYESSGGGVTFSGGEATLQFEFLQDLLKEFKALGIHTALETNGLVPPGRLLSLAESTDLFLFDYKLTDPSAHREHTGADPVKVLNSLEVLGQVGKTVILRCPIIPGINDLPGHFRAIRELKVRYPNISGVEIMPYHNTGKYKWEIVGLDYSLSDLASATPEQKAEWEDKVL